MAACERGPQRLGGDGSEVHVQTLSQFALFVQINFCTLLGMETPTFVVLGATGGIGSALTRHLTASGAHVLGVARDAERLAALAAETGAKIQIADAREPDAVSACLDEAKTTFGRLDGVANCVGSLLLKPAHATSEQEWDDTIATNLKTAFATVRAAAPLLRKEGGAIVLMGSAAARTGLANHEAIAAAKAGVIGLAQSAAATYAASGVRINVVAPGLVETPMTQTLTEREAGRKAAEAMHPAGRIGTADEVANAIAWFLQPSQSWITGQVLGVDGGLATLRPKR